MSRSRVKDYYQHDRHAGQRYDRRRFASAGGRAVSELELEPFRRWVRLADGQTLLDCASGTGRVLSALDAARRKQAVAVDASDAMLESLRKTYPQVRCLKGDLFEFDSDERFDVVTSLRVLDHFDLADQAVLLRRFMGMLKPGGRIVVSVLVRPTLESLVNRFLKIGGMNYFHSRRAYRRLFRQVGLKPTRRFDAFILPRGVACRLPGPLSRALLAADRLLGKILGGLCSYMTVELVDEESATRNSA